MNVTLRFTSDMKLITPPAVLVGHDGDHNFTHFYIERPKAMVGYVCRAEIGVAGKEEFLLVENDTFSLPSSLTKAGILTLQLVFTDTLTGVIAKTNEAQFEIGKSVNAINEADPEFQDGLAQLAATSYSSVDYVDGVLFFYNRNGVEVGRVPIGGGGPGGEGPPGKSAYEIAVLHGFVGTEEEWLESLPGKDGKDGYTIEFETIGFLFAEGKAENPFVNMRAYKGDAALVFRIDDIGNVPNGMTTIIYTNNAVNPGFMVMTSAALTTKSGYLEVKLTIDGKGFTKRIPWALAQKGETGKDGKSAYEVAKDNGFVGSENEWLESIKGEDAEPAKDGKDGKDGKSAYEVALDGGFIGTEQEWIDSLRGGVGENGLSAYEIAVSEGFEGTITEWMASLKGETGKSGLSTYELAVEQGYEGTEAEWLSSLQGKDGLTAYEIALKDGFVGTEAEWLESIRGADGIGSQGLSAYEVAVEQGFVGTKEEWLDSLYGTDGKNAYEVAVEDGFVGTEEEWLLSLRGVDGYTIEFNLNSLLIPAGASAADNSTAQIDVIAYKGATRVNVVIEDVTNAPPGMDVFHTSSALVGTIVAFISPVLTVKSGHLGVKLIVDGITFVRFIPWALALTGKTGADGKSAYQIALDNGFVGTVGEWLVSLHGETGITPHPDPETGNWFLGDEDTGVKARGEDGYTPVKGVDYFDGGDGEIGPQGPGLPPGGAVGQIPVKASEEDYATEWVDHRFFYTTCGTSSTVANKTTPAIPGFKRITGVMVLVEMSQENTASNPTINISNTGAFALATPYGTIPSAADFIGLRYMLLIYVAGQWRIVNSTTATRGRTDYSNYRMRNVALLPTVPAALGDGDIAMVYD